MDMLLHADNVGFGGYMNINEIVATLEELVVRVTVVENKLSSLAKSESENK